MNKRRVIKLAVGGVVGFGAAFIATAIIKKNVVPVKLVHKIAVGAATIAISGMVAHEAERYTHECINETFDFIDEAKQSYKNFLAQINGTADVEGEKSPGVASEDIALDSIVVETENEAQTVLTKLRATASLAKDKMASVGDFLRQVGLHGTQAHDKVGWHLKDLETATIMPTEGGFSFSFPIPESI